MNKIKSLIEKINDKLGDYDEKYIRIKFDSDGDLDLDKELKLYNLTIIVKSVFQEDNKHCAQVFLNECLY